MKVYAKAIIAIVGAALVAAAEQFPAYDGELQVAIALFAAFGVYFVKNASA